MFWASSSDETDEPVVIDNFDDQQDILAMTFSTANAHMPDVYSLDIEYDEENDLNRVTATLYDGFTQSGIREHTYR